MSLLKLCPDSVHLRRIAKAYGAGECSHAEYRRARRVIIEGFQRQPRVEDTHRRREDSDRTLRNEDRTERFDPPSLEPSLNIVAEPAQTSRRWPSERWVFALLLVILGLLLLRAAPVFAQETAQPKAQRIPAVRDRDPNPATSQRLSVQKVQLQGLSSGEGGLRYIGLDQAGVDAAIESSLTEIRARHAVGQNGFSLPELQEVGRLLSAFGVHGEAANLSPSEAQALLDLIATQKQRRGLSVQELEEVAASVQSHVREQGFMLAVVYVPEQEVGDGVVDLAMLPGTLGEVNVNGAGSELAAAELADIQGDVLTRSLLETRLFRINQLPGIRIQASLQPGSQVGAADLNIEVLEERAFAGIVQLDNHGLDDTGEERLGTRLQWRNPFQGGDLLEVGVRSSVDPADQHQLWGRYELPFRQSPYRLEIFAGNNRYDFDAINGIDADLDGDSRLLELGIKRTFWQTRNSSGHARLKLGWHNLTWREFENQRLVFSNLAVTGHKVWDAVRLSLNGGLELEYGSIRGGEAPGQDSGFYRIAGHGLLWTPLQLPMLPGEQKFALRWQAQYAVSELPATRALGMGGPHLNRGFERTQFLADRGLNIGLELRFPLRYGELVTFLDSAYGNGENDRDETWAQLTSLGIGWDANWGPGWTSRMSLGLPVSGDGSPDIDSPDTQFYWKLQYAY
ncbi:MAG: ShlB/FhaC/HecB family hemolysin secretion/activation protein [Pseudomonadales bacterium]